MSERPKTWRSYLAEQDQVIARWQALSGGLTSHAWDYRIAHAWQSVSPGVAVAHTGALSDRERRWAAVLHAGRSAVLSGDAALAELGFKTAGSGGLWGKPAIDVAVPADRNVASAVQRADVRVRMHRVAKLALWVPDHHRDVPTINAHAAVLHAVAWSKSDQAAEWRLAAVVQQGLSAVPLIRQALEQMPKLPRRALIAEVLDDVELGAHAASELRFLRFCRSHGLPLPDELQLKVRAGGTRYLDAHYRRQKLSFELDGAHHRLAGQWEADQLRSLTLAVSQRGSGQQVIRLAPGLLRHRGSEVAELLRTLLRLG